MDILSTSTTAGKILTVIPLGVLLALSCCITGLSLLSYALSGYWLLVIIASFFLGSGGGAIDTSINVFAASQFSPSVINWLHGFYGIGATAGPFLMTWLFVRDQEWYLGYIIVGIVQITLGFIFLATLRYWKVASAREDVHVSGSYAQALRCHESCGASRYKHTLFPEPTIQSCLFLTSFCNINRFTEMFQHCSSVQPLNPPALPPAFRTSYGGPSFATTLIPRKLRRALLRCYAHPAQATAGEAH